MRKIGIIGGTGVEDTSIFGTLSLITVETPFGTAEGFAGKIDDTSVYFIARHGKGHSLPPHRIPYRANIYALKKLGVTEILSFTAVGSLNRGLIPGTFVNTSQILDFTKSREHTFLMAVSCRSAMLTSAFPIVQSCGSGSTASSQDLAYDTVKLAAM